MSRTSIALSGKILVVDDEPEIVALIRNVLTSRGYSVVGLSNSQEAPSKCDSFRPDVCILDFRMPHCSGSVLLDTIKQKGVSLSHLHVQNNKLFMQGAAPSEQAKNDVWNVSTNTRATPRSRATASSSDTIR